jgi:hypothetical protein
MWTNASIENKASDANLELHILVLWQIALVVVLFQILLPLYTPTPAGLPAFVLVP